MRGQNPVALDDESAPEPDLAVVDCDPAADLTAPFGWRDTSVERFRPPGAVRSLAVPATSVRVAALLP